jgi:hypothetical protein
MFVRKLVMDCIVLDYDRFVMELLIHLLDNLHCMACFGGSLAEEVAKTEKP